MTRRDSLKDKICTIFHNNEVWNPPKCFFLNRTIQQISNFSKIRTSFQEYNNVTNAPEC